MRFLETVHRAVQEIYKAQGACGEGQEVLGVKEGALKGEMENQ